VPAPPRHRIQRYPDAAASLGEPEAARLRAAGRALSADAAMQLALEPLKRPWPDPGPPSGSSASESAPAESAAARAEMAGGRAGATLRCAA
jgi:hypothetical protein